MYSVVCISWTHWRALQKRLNWSRCRLLCGFGMAHWTMYYMGLGTSPGEGAIWGRWRCGMVLLLILWPLVTVKPGDAHACHVGPMPNRFSWTQCRLTAHEPQDYCTDDGFAVLNVRRLSNSRTLAQITTWRWKNRVTMATKTLLGSTVLRMANICPPKNTTPYICPSI